MNLALFDFDGTLTRADTMFAFARHAVGLPRFALGMAALTPALVAHALGLLPAARAKERFLARFFGGWPASRLAEAGRLFCREVLPGTMRPGALERVAWHRARGDRILVVSASCEAWLAPFCEAHGLELVATRLEVRDGLVTGRLASANCNGVEKVNRIRALLDPAGYAEIHAYGDSPGDRPMLDLATERHWRPFR